MSGKGSRVFGLLPWDCSCSREERASFRYRLGRRKDMGHPWLKPLSRQYAVEVHPLPVGCSQRASYRYGIDDASHRLGSCIYPEVP